MKLDFEPCRLGLAFVDIRAQPERSARPNRRTKPQSLLPLCLPQFLPQRRTHPMRGARTAISPWNKWRTQLRSIDRGVNRELRENLAGLSERVRKEVEMNSPELQRLQSLSAQLRSNQGQFEASANELADRAADLAEMAQEKTQGNIGPGP